MAKTVEQAIPDELQDVVAARAEARGMSVAEYVDRELHGDFSTVNNDQILDEILAQPRVHLALSTADIIRELRGPLPEANGDRR